MVIYNELYVIYGINEEDILLLNTIDEVLNSKKDTFSVLKELSSNMKQLQKIYKSLPGEKNIDKMNYKNFIYPVKRKILSYFRRAKFVLSELNPSYKIVVTVATGRFHSIPYVAFLNKSVTKVTSKGFYVVVLFDPQYDEFYLSLNMGVNKLISKSNFNELKEKLMNEHDHNIIIEPSTLTDLMHLKSNKNKNYFSNDIVSTKISGFNPGKANDTINKLLEDTDRLIQEFLKKGIIKLDDDILIDPSDVTNYDEIDVVVSCEVENCNRRADYAVIFYDKYPDGNEYIGLNKNIGYICQHHMSENETRMTGDRSPKSVNNYLYTSVNTTGFTKYLQLSNDEIQSSRLLSELDKEDKLDIAKEVEALYEMIYESGRDNLNIGIFGEWGSGKTFFVNELGKRFENNDDHLFVTFNAWNYYDTNVVTNLVYKVYEEINSKCFECDDTPSEFQKMVAEHNSIANEEIESKIKELERLRTDVSKDRVDFILNTFEVEFKNEFGGGLENFSTYLDDIIDFKNNSDNRWSFILREISNIYMWLKERKRNAIVAIASLIIIVFAINGVLDVKEGIVTIISKISFFSMFITSALASIRGSKIYNFIGKASKNYIKNSNYNNDIDKYNNEIEKLTIEKKSYGEDMSREAIRHFIENKLESELYTKKIGYTHAIKKDLLLIKDWLESSSIDSGLSKIILVIDDLDRCSSEQVIQVLQSVHLLLSSDLFTVILTVDSKWVINSIKSNYTQINKSIHDDYTAIEYLQKIIHFPFWMNSMSENLSVKFIKDMNNSNVPDDTDDVPIGSTNINVESVDASNEDNRSFTIEYFRNSKSDDEYQNSQMMNDDELELLSKYKYYMRSSNPRAMKRFINSYLMIKNGSIFSEVKSDVILLHLILISFRPRFICKLFKETNIFEICVAEKNNEDIINEIDKSITDFIENNKEFSEVSKHYLNHLSQIDQFGNLYEIVYQTSRYTYYHNHILK